MMDSVRIFTRNFIKFFIYIAVFAQIVSGTVYLVCNFNEFIVYPETEEMVHAARTLIFDEYIGFLYPLFIRVCLSVQNMCGVGYYLLVHGVQLVAMFFAMYYLVKSFFIGKRAWLATAYVMSIPMCMQTALMVSPFAFKAVFGFLIAGSLVRLWRDAGKVITWIILLLSCALAAFNVPDDLFVWLVPVGVFSFIVFFRKSDKLRIAKRCCILLAVVLVFFGTFGILSGVTEAGSRGRMHKTVSSVLFQRTVWPGLGEKYGFLPLDIQYYIGKDEMAATDSSAEMVTNVIGPRIELHNGVEKSEKLFMEAAVTQFGYNKRAIFQSVTRDFAGYLLSPYSTIGYIQGEDGSAFGTLYSRMSIIAPKMTYNYFAIFYISLFVLTFVMVLNVIKNKVLANKKSVKTGLLIVCILIYQALWYSIVNVQGVDYRYVLLNMGIYALAVFGGSLSVFGKKENETAQTIEKKSGLNKKHVFVAAGGVVFVSVIVLILSVVLRNHYQESDLLKENTIVCFGDSIWGLVDDETGIAAYVEKMTGANVENYAISGTTASDFDKTSEKNSSKWNLCQIVDGLDKNSDEEIQDFVEMEASLENADYLILAYGLNDYFQGIEAQSEEAFNVSSYAGALRNAVEYFRENYPDTQIVLIGQTYCQFYSYGIVVDDSDTCNFGGGVGTDYVEAAQQIADEYGLIFINMYREIEMNEWNGTVYLEDATHLNENGRRTYAQIVAEYLLTDYEERNAQ